LLPSEKHTEPFRCKCHCVLRLGGARWLRRKRRNPAPLRSG
jgi:hypothetical protein